jgi:death-on-curing protein
LAVHAQQIERFGGLHGVRDVKLVHGALNRPRNLWAYSDQCDLAELAAMYLAGFAGSQGFNDGNKRTGVACALVFLVVNGIRVEAISATNLLEITMKVATGQAKPDEVAAFFRNETGGKSPIQD